MELFADDIIQEDLDAIAKVLGDALLPDGSIDYAKLDAKTAIIDLDEWEQSFTSLDTKQGGQVS